MTTPSAQLRELEGEIKLIMSRRQWIGCRPEARQYLQGVISNLLTIAKELEADRDTLKRGLDEANETFAAIKRLHDNSYTQWGYAGGPNECMHGYAEGIPCPKCDTLTVNKALGRITEIDKL